MKHVEGHEAPYLCTNALNTAQHKSRVCGTVLWTDGRVLVLPRSLGFGNYFNRSHALFFYSRRLMRFAWLWKWLWQEQCCAKAGCVQVIMSRRVLLHWSPVSFLSLALFRVPVRKKGCQRISVSWVEFILRPVSRPVRLGIELPFGTMTRFYPFFSDNCFVVLPVGRPLWQEDGSVV
jgi:hypothetical protein